MICKYCGERIPDDAKFCANCGNIVENEDIKIPSGYCTNCGAPVYGDNTVCGKCGQRLDVSDNAYDAEQPQYAESSETIYDNIKTKSNHSDTTLIVVLVIIIVALIGGIITFFVFRNNFIQPKDNNSQNALVEEETKNTQTPESYATIKPEETPEPTLPPEPTSPPAPTVPPVTKAPSTAANTPANAQANTAANAPVENPSYLWFASSDYNFGCDYPSHFVAFYEPQNEILSSLKSPDGSAVMRICGAMNTHGQTSQQVMDIFLSHYNGKITYQVCQDDYMAISVLDSSKFHYAYYSLRDGKIRGFEYHYDSKYENIYSKYIDHVYDSISWY